MSTTVRSRGPWPTAPSSSPTRDSEPFINCRVMVTNRTRKTAGEWVDGESTAHDIQVCGTAAANHYDSANRGDRVLMRSLMTNATCFGRDGQQKRTQRVVEAGNRIGNVDGSFRVAATRTKGQRLTTSSVTSPATLAQSDVQPAAAERAAG